jgi:hypothetical protein
VNLDVFTESAHKIITSETHRFLYYGEHSAMTGDGTRLVLTSHFSEGNIEVWDFNENRQWIFKTRFSPPDINCTIQGLDMSEDGSRIIVSRCTDVRVFEDATGYGTNWSQVGETLDEFSISPFVDGEEREVGLLGEAAMSSNGNVIAFTAPHISKAFGRTNMVHCTGVVKVFQHVDLVVSSGQEKTTNNPNNDKTWISLGQDIFGERDEWLGQAVDISGDGHHLVVPSGDYSYRSLRVRVFEFDGEA